MEALIKRSEHSADAFDCPDCDSKCSKSKPCPCCLGGAREEYFAHGDD